MRMDRRWERIGGDASAMIRRWRVGVGQFDDDELALASSAMTSRRWPVGDYKFGNNKFNDYEFDNDEFCNEFCDELCDDEFCDDN